MKPRVEVHGFYGKESTADKGSYTMRKFKTLLLFIPFFWGCARSPYFYNKNKGFLQGCYHKIKQGETLWNISQQYGITVENIRKWNSISSLNNIRTGRLLFIPISPSQTPKIKDQSSSTQLFRNPLNISQHDYTHFLKEGGLTILAPSKADVFASASGRIIFSGAVRGMGNTILIEHSSGYITVYSYLGKIFIKENDWVKRGKKIAVLKKRQGNNNSILRFEIRKGGRMIYPLSFFV